MKNINERIGEYKFKRNQYEKKLADSLKELALTKTKLDNVREHVIFPIMILTAFGFFCAIYLEVIFSYEMYLDVASRNLSDTSNIKITAFILIVIVVILAAFCAHKLRLILYNDIRKYEVAMLQVKSFSNREAQINIKKSAIRSGLTGIVLSSILLGFVYYVSLERVELLSVIDETMEFSKLEIFLPVIFVLLEILMGAYLFILIKFIINKSKLKSLKSKILVTEENIEIMKQVIASCEDMLDKPDPNDNDFLGIAV